MVRANFYMYQKNLLTCDRAIVRSERNDLTCFNEKFQIRNVKTETFSICPPARQPLFQQL